MTATTTRQVVASERSSNFGSLLAKWKQMESSSTMNDRTSLISLTMRVSRRVGPSPCASSVHEQPQHNSNNSGNNVPVTVKKPWSTSTSTTSKACSTTAISKNNASNNNKNKTNDNNHVLKKSIRLFRSKRFETSMSTATTLESCLDHSDMSDTCNTEEDGDELRLKQQLEIDPVHLITSKERKAHILDHSFEDYYTLGNELGKGAYAIVRAAKHKRTQETYAVKIVATAALSQSDLQALQTEMGIMAQLQHPHLVALHEIYKVHDDYHIVMEYIRGGELLDRIVQKEYYNEKDARNVCRALFQAMDYCHGRNIAHRDLKPENLLLVSETDDADVKIADFGFAKRCPAEGYTTMCGTPSYVAPEILTTTTSGPYNVQCDMWSLGVIVYILLGGYAPFGDGHDERELYRNITAGCFEFHMEYWDPVSDSAKDFIKQLLTVDPKKRLTSDRALHHAWLTACEDELAAKDLTGSLQELKRFNAKRKFRAAVNTLIAAQRITVGLGLHFTPLQEEEEEEEEE